MSCGCSEEQIKLLTARGVPFFWWFLVRDERTWVEGETGAAAVTVRFGGRPRFLCPRGGSKTLGGDAVVTSLPALSLDNMSKPSAASYWSED